MSPRSVGFNQGAVEDVFLFLLQQVGKFLALIESLVVNECKDEGEDSSQHERRFLEIETSRDSRDHQGDEEGPEVVFSDEDSRSGS